MTDIIQRKDVQFIAWIVAIIISISIPFATYGSRIEQLEKQMAKVDLANQELVVTLTDIQIRLAQIQKDIEYLKIKQ